MRVAAAQAQGLRYFAQARAGALACQPIQYAQAFCQCAIHNNFYYLERMFVYWNNYAGLLPFARAGKPAGNGF